MMMVSDADVKPLNEQSTPRRRRQERALSHVIGCNNFCEFHGNGTAYTLTDNKTSRGVGNM